MRWALRSAGVLALAIAALFLFGPREPVVVDVRFDPARFETGVAAYFEQAEADVPDLREGVEKRVIWAGAPEVVTPVSVVYLHGFSASSEEIRPVPDLVAEALGANLIYTRFKGHGRDGDAMATARVQDWMADAAEALAAARAVGDEVLVVATSTGASIATAALAQPELAEDVLGAVLVSPNFGIKNALAPLLTWPAARHWLPVLVGARRAFEPHNERQAAYWTTDYPSVAVFPMAAIVKHAAELDHMDIPTPALFYYSERDGVVEAQVTRRVAEAWGGPVTRGRPDLREGDDPLAHVIAGDIMSPGNTAAATARVLDWIATLRR
jgi:alpha-beta hydrolase superfamily lysophospholipase